MINCAIYHLTVPDRQYLISFLSNYQTSTAYCLFSAACCFCLGGCFTDVEGCLDLAATNFDVNADKACMGCCEFPELTLAFQHRALPAYKPDTSFSFKYDTPYSVFPDTSHKFTVQRIRFFISNFKLVKENGEEVGVLDSLELEAPAGMNVVVEDNFAKVDRDIFQANKIGSFVTQGVFRKIRFTLGLAPELLNTDPESVPAGHPLSVEQDSINFENGIGYIPLLIQLKKDVFPAAPSTKFKIFEPLQVDLKLQEPFEMKVGFNLAVSLQINYLAWFAGVDFVNDDDVQIQNKIAQNLEGSFSVIELKLN